ncbi:MAG: molybdopterin-dependent oxidoreductase, partial [Candidatus Thorarchaeota archaeon]|nr:molybdopterin-dependent oxidoreductase [Candidatus Thorarchaeota archaeon]NIW14700.1 molybdopterin-dependent oxidoreductase [Candidatus Thorarchaeota archaeon]
SEVATLYCPFDKWEITLNWTGIPLFYLLTLAGVKEEGASVNFKGRDGYTSNIRMAEVLKPTAILALKGNGTDLSEMTGREGGFRVAFPCKDGYNWATDIVEINVINEVLTKSDQDREGCALPSIHPPLRVFNLTLGKRELEIRAFTNVSVNGFSFDRGQKQFHFNITVPAGTTGFTELIMPQNLLEEPYSVFMGEEPVEFIEVNVANLTFIHLSYPEVSPTHTLGRTLTVTVEGQSGDAHLARPVSAGIIGISVLILTILLLRREPELLVRLLERLKTLGKASLLCHGRSSRNPDVRSIQGND